MAHTRITGVGYCRRTGFSNDDSGSSGGSSGSAITSLDDVAWSLQLDERGQTIAAGSEISPWVDQSATGYDVSQLSGPNRPLTGSTINGLPAPEFTGDYLNGPTAFTNVFTSLSEFEGFVVLRADTLGADAALWYNRRAVFSVVGSPTCIGLTTTTSGVSLGIYLASAYYSTPYTSISTGVDTLIGFRFEGGTGYVQVAGGAESSGALAASFGTSSGALRVGSNYSGGQNFDGRIATLLISPTVLSTEDRAAVRSLLATKYAVAA